MKKLMILLTPNVFGYKKPLKNQIMKTIKLLLLSLVVLCCSKDDEPITTMAATEYGVYVKGATEVSYRFYDYHTGETYHEGITSNSRIMFPVTSKEKPTGSVLGNISSTTTDEIIQVFAVIKSGDFYLNSEDNPNATSIWELNQSFILDDGTTHEVVMDIAERSLDLWRRSFSNN